MIELGLKLFLLILVIQHGSSEGIKEKKQKVKFDYFVFAMQWPETACTDANYTRRHNCSINGNVSTWTIHGLWPSQNNDTMSPVNCNSSDKFNLSEVQPLRTRLDAYWPNLFTDEPVESLWSHEWVKHGTCAKAGQAVDSQYGYFKLALNIQQKLNIFQNLKKKGIYPKDGYSYTHDDFYSSLSEIVGGKTVIIQCFHERHQKSAYIEQIQICLDRSLKPIDCTPNPKAECPPNKPIDYPTIKHPY